MRARPRVALVGVGRFGRNHLRVLRSLHRQCRIELAGIVGRTPARARRDNRLPRPHELLARLPDVLELRVAVRM